MDKTMHVGRPMMAIPGAPPGGTPVVRVLVAAASAVSRAGLEAVVTESPALARAGATSLARLREDAAALHPDVVLVLIEGDEGRALAELEPDLPPVVVLAESVDAWAHSFLRHGVLGALPRNADPPQIVAAIVAVANGLTTLHPLLASTLLSATPRPPAGSFQALTPREVEVLRMLAEGLGNKIIADRLRISEHTVKFHLSSIFSKLNAGSRTEAVTLGARLGYIVI